MLTRYHENNHRYPQGAVLMVHEFCFAPTDLEHFLVVFFELTIYIIVTMKME